MTSKISPYQGLLTAGNNHYHGMKSVQENGAIAHASKLAQILVREKMVGSEEEAISLANFEVQRLRWQCNGFQGNRIAREELRQEREQACWYLDSSTRTA